MKVALVHDWLTGMRGGERVLEALGEIFPQAPIYTLFHFPGTTSPSIENHSIVSSFLQKFPFMEKYYRYTYPLMPFAIEGFDLSKFDLILSTSHRIAKGVLVSPHTCHISYIHSPMRDAWELTDEYFGKGQMSWWKRTVIPPQLTFLRLWDQISTVRVDYLIANSKNTQNRITHIYQRESAIIYPPVSVDIFNPVKEKKDFYLLLGSFEPNKRMNLAIEAFTRSGLPLKIISGTGRGHQEALRKAGENIEFLGWLSDEEVAKYYAQAKAFIFPGVDDFGITPLEAQAAGTPVVAFAEGGALETVIEGETGVFFHEPTSEALQEAVRQIDQIEWQTETLVRNAQKFSRDRFKKEIEEFINQKIKVHHDQLFNRQVS